MNELILFNEKRFIKCIEEAVEANAKCPNPTSQVERDEIYRYVNELIKIVGDIRIIDLHGTSSNLLTGIYISKKLLDDSWENLAGDSSFDFELVITSENYGPFQKNLFFFLNSLVRTNNDDALNFLNLALDHYLKLLIEIDKKTLEMR